MRIVEGVALALVLVLPPLAFACGGSSGDTPPAVDAGNDAPVDTGVLPPGDAGPDIEQPEDIYPAAHADIPQLDFLGGPVLDHVKIVTVTFYHTNPDAGAPDAAGPDAGDTDGGDGGTDATVADAGEPDAADNGRTPDIWRESLRRFGDTIVKSDWWHQTMSGFKVSDGSGGLYGELDDATVINTTITDQDIQDLITNGVISGELPPPEDQMLYAVYFPASTQIANFNSTACVDFLGYHFEAEVINGSDAKHISYAVMPRCKSQSGTAVDTKDQLTVTASHEFAEAASDPFPSSNPAYLMATNDAWVPSLGLGTAGDENGDVCIFAPNYDQDGYKVQPIWSNESAKNSHEPCQPQPINADPIYFNAAVRTEKQKINGHNSFGYVVVPRGGSVDVVINFFSTAALPHDVSLFVGKDKSVGDPTDMAEISNGITSTLSRLQAHNGNAIIMTLTAPATAVKGDYRFLVRSVLETTDYHDWPVIAHVQ